MTVSSHVFKSTTTMKVGMFSLEARRELALFDSSFVALQRMAHNLVSSASFAFPNGPQDGATGIGIMPLRVGTTPSI